MPIYEYKCRDCKAQFEIITTSTSQQKEPVRCKECNSPNTGKMISSSSFRLNKGSSIPAGALSGCSSRSGFS